MTNNIVIEANKRDYSLIANEFSVGDQASYQAQWDRTTSFGDTRIVDAGDTRIIFLPETSNPFVVIANKRDYSLNAPLVEVV